MLNLTKRLAYALCSFLLLSLFVTVAQGQSSRGQLSGNVLDASGASIPGAIITAVNEANGGKNVTKSGDAGNYRFSDIPLGNYTVTVTAPGFATTTSDGVTVQINTTTALNVVLKPGAVSETVTVDASGLRLETESSDISGTISNKQIEDLPLSLLAGVGGLRSPETFVFLLPGTTGPGSGTSGNTGNGVFFSRLSGGQAYGAEVLLDGASIQRSENGSSFDETSPSIEALQEFKVTTSTPQAEFGRTTAGIESFATKGGANRIHGTGYAIVKNRVFDANTWFNNGFAATNCVGVSEINCTYKKQQDSKYDYGGVIDGPVRIPHLYDGRDKSFFLFSFENFQYHQSFPTQSTVPTAAERTGDFRDILGGPVPASQAPYNINPCTGQQVFYNEIFDPTTDRPGPNPGQYCRLPFATTNVIPAGQLSPAAQKLIAGLPLPNQNPTPDGVFPNYLNYASSGNVPNTNTTYTVRVDQNIGIKSKLFATYSTRENFKLTGPPTFPAPFNNSGFVQDFTTHYTRIGYDYTITPTLLNHLNIGYNRTNSINLGAGFNSPLANSAGISGLLAPFYPVINFVGPDNLSSLGQQQNGQNIDNGLRFNDSVSWQKGRNSFKFGADVRFQQYSVINYNTDSLTFYRDQTSVQNQGPQYLFDGSTFASFLTGYVGASNQTVFNDHPRWNSHYLAGFAQDDIKFTNNLTVNVGLRYDVDVPRHEALNRTSILSLTAPDAAAGNLPGALVFGANCNCNTAWADTWFKDIAPRLGLAYVLPGTNGKLVIRAGGAIIYGPLQYNDFGGSTSAGYTQSRSPTSVNASRGTFGHSFQLDSGFKNADGSSVNFAPSLDPTQLTGPAGASQFNAVGGEVITPSDGRPSMTSNWSLQLQDELAQDLILKIGYIGQTAQNLRSGDLTNYNNISKSYFGLGDKLNNSQFFIPVGGSNSGVNAPYSGFAGNLGQALRPFPQYDFIQGDCCLENLGHSSYNAMVASVERRFRNGFNLQASYTWSKSLTDADSTIPFSYVSGNQLEQGQDNTNLRLEKAVSVQNIPQTFVLSYLYQLPFGKGRKFLNSNRVVDLLIGGFQVGAIQRYQSGQNISFGCATGIPYYQNCISYTQGPASAGGTDFTTAAFKSNKNGPNEFNQQSWFKPAYRTAGTNGTGDAGVPMAQAAFVDQNAEGLNQARPLSAGCAGGQCSFAPFSLGNIPRVTQAVTGPIYKSEDISVLKDFHIHERQAFQLKLEAFDLFNRHRFALPNLSPSAFASNSTGFGVPTATDYGPRSMQISGRFNF